MSEIKLKSCPFCGGSGELYKDSFEKYFAGCPKCDFYYGIEIESGVELINGWKAKYKTINEAVESWNRRAGEQPTVFDKEKVIEQLQEASYCESSDIYDDDGYKHDYYDSEVIDLDKAIEIVEKGGIE
jgi:hypothetical protein